MKSENRRICFVTTLPVTLRTFVLPQTLRLIDEGWEVAWASSDDIGFDADIPKAVRFFRLPINRGIDVLGLPRVIFLLYRLFRKERFSIVQYSTPNASFCASTAAVLARVPVRLYAQWGLRYVGFKGILRVFFKQLDRWVCFCSTVVEPDSRSNLEFSIEEGLYKESKGRVVGHGSACGVNLKRFDIAKKGVWRAEIRNRHSYSDSDFVIGFVGSLRKDKGVNELLAACRKVFVTNSNANLLLIGDKTFYDDINIELRNWAESSNRVLFIAPTTEIPQFMACMDIFCLPSYREGFGLVIAEAEAMGVPVVASNVPGPVDAMINEKTGIIVPARSVDGLARGISRLMGDKELRKSLGRNAFQFAVEKFEQKAFLDLVVKDKESLLENWRVGRVK